MGYSTIEAPSDAVAPRSWQDEVKEIAYSFAPLGFIAFGGPQAHIALLHAQFVETHGWLGDDAFLELLALGHALPGPTSTQMVVAVAASRGGIVGALVGFIFWGLPAMTTLIVAGSFADKLGLADSPAWAAGLAPSAVALIYAAALKIGTKTTKRADGTTDPLCVGVLGASALALVRVWNQRRHSCARLSVEILATVRARKAVPAQVVVLASGDARVPPHAFDFIYPALLAAGGVATALRGAYDAPAPGARGLDVRVSLPVGGVLIALWAVVLVGGAWLRSAGMLVSMPAKLFETFYRVGSTIFGGGQVVLPMLLTHVVEPGWVSEEAFYAGLALTQSLPGPLFNFSAYLGTVAAGVAGGLASVAGLFGPGCVLILATSPFWLAIRERPSVQAAKLGVNAAAAGLVTAACAMLTFSAVKNAASAAVVLLVAGLTSGGGLPAPSAVATGAVTGFVLAAAGVAQDPY
mmetsp:Transcript_11482/g.35372  ORF Transcript_11482/g.35372 Transcript_11482/m.35372 type:complete len:465 (-) Transcript_11482:43-1437(-)